jgi:hypothetical protein
MRISRKLSLAAGIAVLALLASASPALAQCLPPPLPGESHPCLFSFGSFSNPNGIAVDESSGDVYVADLGTNTVSKFDANGKPVAFECTTCPYVTGNQITGTPGGSFLFPNDPGDRNPAALAIDNSTSPSDPSAGDLYVLDAGHEVIDKFNAKGESLTSISGPFSGALLGLGVDANGNVRVDVKGSPSTHTGIAVFDNSAANSFVRVLSGGQEETITSEQERGFATGTQPGSDYPLLACGCVAKVGAEGESLGQVDDGSTAVAAAVDPVTGHLYIDDQLSVTEWDTGQMNGQPNSGRQNTGTLVASFGSPQLTSSLGQGGIAVNGASGDVYVSNPADGQVYAFGSNAPATAAGAAADVTETSATLQGTVDPRGVPVTSCVFEYATSPSTDLTLPIVNMDRSVPCVTQHGEQIGEGTSPVAVHAEVSGLEPGSLYHFRLVAGNTNGASPSAGLFPTVGAGFGIKSFEVSFLNKDGTPDTQAGSHPYEMLTNIAFNTNVVRREALDDLRYITQPIGNAKDIVTDLPPGLFGDPNATTKKCTPRELKSETKDLETECPAESELGDLLAEYRDKKLQPLVISGAVFNMVPPPGVAVQLGAQLILPSVFIDVGVPAGGDSGARATVTGVPVTAPVLRTKLAIFGGPPLGSKKPFLTLPSACNGPLTSTVSMDSYQNPGHFVGASSVTRNAAGTPGGMTGCAQLTFPPTIETKPDVSNASSSSGLNVGVHVSQKAALNPEGLSESALRDTTVALPPGVAVNPAGGDGLAACSEGLVGFMKFVEFNPGFEPGDQTATFSSTLLGELQPGVSFCPDGSKIGTAKLKTPLLEKELEGAVYLATPAPNGEERMNPFNSLIAMYMVIEDKVSGTLVKVPFEVKLCEAAGQVINGMTCQAVGQIITTAKNTPQLPFEDLQLHFFGGERAPLATPSRCGTYTTLASFTPWDGKGPVNTSASFQVEHGPNGGPCPAGGLPFNPSLTAGSSNIQAGAFSPFTMTMSREDGEQNLQAISLKMPPGLSGLLSGVKLCGEAKANAGTCGPESEIGETIVSVGVGSSPFAVKGGKVFITGPYRGAPFGLSIVNPAKAGPFDLGKVIVRAKIEVDPITTALTITSDNEGAFKIPQYIRGIPLQIKHVNVTITRPGFTFNPTSCNNMQIGGSLSSTEGATQTLAVPFQAHDCATLKFAPKFSASTSGKTSKAKGASLNVKLVYPKAPFGSQANIRSVKVDLPKQLPSRLTTLQKACTAAQFKANPAGCPAASLVGHAKATTPLIPVPLEGPAYFVSNGDEAFPNLIMVLQGYGVTIDLVGDTFISKAGITSSTFNSVPDAPVGSFELTLPQSRYSALTANGNLCGATRTVITHKRVARRVHGRVVHVRRTVKRTVVQPLLMPTSFTAQNGAVFKQTTKIAVAGCAKKSHRHGKGKAKKKKG